MLALNTRFASRNLTAPRLFKVLAPAELIARGPAACAGAADFDDILLWLGDSPAAQRAQMSTLAVGGFIDPRQDDLPDTGRVQLTRADDPEVVQPGDVIAVSPDTPAVRVLYRRGANSNLLFMTDRCNSLCLMCSQPPRDVDDRWHIEENLCLLDLVDPGEEHLGISGGEPTLYRAGLLAILDKARQVIPEKHLHILSNGRALADPGWGAELARVNHPGCTWGIPLYADNAADHDHVVQASGAFSETLRGLYALARAEQSVEIRVVLSRLTVPRLPQLAHFIFRNLPFVRHVAFMGLESTGLARKHHEALWIDPLDYQAPLGEACHFLDIRGMASSLYNLPLCVLEPSLAPFYRRSISDWKNRFIDTCQGCAATTACGGFFKSHSPRWESRGIRPLKAAELARYTGVSP